MDHAKLYQLAAEQKHDEDALDGLNGAVVAFGRWRGLTDETDDQRHQAKALLDKIADELEPDDWQRLRDFTPLLGADTIRELMAYSLSRANEDLKGKTRDLERHYETTPPDDDEDNSGAKDRERRRRRERDR